MVDIKSVLRLVRDGIETYAPDYMHGLPKRDYLKQIDVALAQPQCQWVGLTDEVEECKFKALNGTGWSMDVSLDDYAKAIEAKLKEKNT